MKLLFIGLIFCFQAFSSTHVITDENVLKQRITDCSEVSETDGEYFTCISIWDDLPDNPRLRTHVWICFRAHKSSEGFWKCFYLFDNFKNEKQKEKP